MHPFYHSPVREIRSPPFVRFNSDGAYSQTQPTSSMEHFVVQSHEATACATNLLCHLTADAHREVIKSIKRQLKTVVLVDCDCFARDRQGYVALFETALSHGLSVYLHTKMD